MVLFVGVHIIHYHTVDCRRCIGNPEIGNPKSLINKEIRKSEIRKSGNWDLSGVLMPEKSFSHVPPDNYNTGNSDKRKLPFQNKEELLIPCGLEIPDLDFTIQHSDIQVNG